MIIEGSKIVIQQILILFIMIGIGYVAAQCKIVDEKGAQQFTNLILYIITPSVIITSFQVTYSRLLVFNMLIAAFISILTHILGALLSNLVFKKENDERKRILTYSTVFFNAGFFALPLLRAIFGDIAVMYGSIFVALFSLISWTYGISLMETRNNKINYKVVINPGMISIIIALMIFFFEIKIPSFFQSSLTTLSKVHSPLAMIIIGIQFFTFRKNFSIKDRSIWKTVLIRDLLIPLLILPVVYFLTKDKTLFFSCVLTSAAPTAANAVLFATKFERDVNLAVQAVMLTTIMVLLTVPIIMSISIFLFGSI